MIDFHKLRHDKNHHLGMGDVRITMAQQDELEAMLVALEKTHDLLSNLVEDGHTPKGAHYRDIIDQLTKNLEVFARAKGDTPTDTRRTIIDPITEGTLGNGVDPSAIGQRPAPPQESQSAYDKPSVSDQEILRAASCAWTKNKGDTFREEKEIDFRRRLAAVVGTMGLVELFGDAENPDDESAMEQCKTNAIGRILGKMAAYPVYANCENKSSRTGRSEDAK